MTTFHAFLGCSLDGYIAGPSGELDWLTTFDSTGFDEFFDSVEVLAMGRHSYETMQEIGPEFYRGKPVHVLSTTTTAGPGDDLGQSPVTVHPSIAALRASLEEQGVARAYADGGRTVQAFVAAGLLSDLTVTRVPVLLGAGIPLFGSDPGPSRLELVDSRSTRDGAVQSVYRFLPARG